MTPAPADPVLLIAPEGAGVRAIEPSPEARTAIDAAADANGDADIFLLRPSGARADPAWRGRRCRSHERNLESLRFACLVPPGALAARRTALEAALAEPLPPRAEGWRELTRRLCAASRVVRVAATAAALGDAPCPAFAGVQPSDVLVMGQIEVSTSLYFDFLEAAPDIAVRFRALTRLEVDAPHLAAARLVVLTRTLHRFWDEGVIAFLEAAGVPWVWFTDDNFQVLAAERGAPGFFSGPRMRRTLAGAAEVWASTPALAAALAPLHPRVKVWGPVLDPLLAGAQPAPSDRLTIAAPGGDFRVAGLAEGPIQALRGLAAAAQLRIVATAAAAAALAPELPGVEVIAMPMERSFRQFLRQWRRHAPDLVLHPAGATANAPYKCPTAAIVAGYLGAVPVVAGEPAYEGWGAPEGVFRLEEHGLAAAAALARDPAGRTDLRARLGIALAARFGDGGRSAWMMSLGRDARHSSRAVLPALGGRRAALRIAAVTRRMRDVVARP